MVKLGSCLLVVTLSAVPVLAYAQETPAAPAPPPAHHVEPAKKLVPLDVAITVSRYRGDKKVSSVPFSVAINANDVLPSQLRMGANVPVPAMMAPKEKPAAGSPPPGPVSYRDIGTNIDCTAKTLDDGGFQLYVVVEDTSVYTDVDKGSGPAAEEMPVFRSFKTRNTLVLRDGQSRQFTAATDRVNGEVVKIDVTLRVVK